jgi:hemerythrin
MTSNPHKAGPDGEPPRAPAAPELGDEDVDRQHRVLLQRWAGVERAAPEEDLRQLGAKLWFIERYTQEHFASEERLMAEGAFPEADRHVRRHRQFAARLGRLRQDVAAGRHLISSADYAWVMDWFERHIQEEDLRLKRHLDGRRRATGTGGI